MRRARSITVGIMTAAVLAAMVQVSPSAFSAQPPADQQSSTQRAVDASANSSEPMSQIAPLRRDEVLGGGWAKSSDRLVVARGDQTGLHLLSAKESEGYAFRTVASLSEPGVETDRWIGNFCLTQSGRHAVVVYGPRSFTNKPDLMERGAFTAVVDMATGAVKKIALRSTMASFNPGCGVGESAVVTQSKGGDDPSGTATSTRLFRVDAATGIITKPVSVPGQITSAVPAKGGSIVAAASRRLVSVNATGKLSTLAATASVPYKLVAGADGGVTYLDQLKDSGRVNHVSGRVGDTAVVLADAPLVQVDLARGTNGDALVLGQATARRALPSHVRKVAGVRALEVSSLGHLSVVQQKRTPPTGEQAALAQGASPQASEWERSMTLPKTEDGMAATATIETLVHATGKSVKFDITPGVRPTAKIDTGGTPHPLNGAAAPAGARTTSKAGTGTAVTSALTAGSPTSSIDSDATCSIPRNDPDTQVYQPTPRQVEWATNQAVTGNLTMTRSSNWKESGMGTSWTPQGLFPPLALTGGGRVPSQIMLGVMSQESNLWQASGHALSGVPGNPLIGNFYGREIYDADTSNDWDINFSDADCGYGVTQITDGMRKASSPRPGEVILGATQQRAAAVDYATNIAAGLRILQDKWNQTKSAGIVHSDGDPANMENWFFAVWAYNSGLHTQAEGTPWGLGWLNNPVNPNYPANRTPFGVYGTDASHPGDWPYPEKVIGFAAYSIATVDGPGFRAAWWVDVASRDRAKPPVNQFCTSANTCVPGALYTPNSPEVVGEPAGPCANKNASGQYDLKCWWNVPSTFNNCAQGYCGNELLRFNSTYPEQPDGTHNPPNCARTGLPANALVIDDVATSAAPISTSTRPCASPGTNAGTFSLRFNADTLGRYPSKVDFHQIGAGYGGHMWFAHTRKSTDLGGKMGVTGTWTLSSASTSWSRVMVHLPDTGAHTQQAAYKINLGDGTSKTRYALQRTQKNGWISLGVVKFNGTPSIELSSATKDGTGDEDIAWDAVAIAPLSAKPANFVVALGDSYSSGEGASDPAGGPYGDDPDADDYYKETDFGGDLADDGGRNACHRSPFAWSRKAVLADNMSESMGARDTRWDSSIDFQFHACSGGQTENINPTGVVNAFGQGAVGQYGEMTQIDKGYLDSNTTLVMLTMGGNDARFADIIVECVFAAGLYACPDAKLSGESDPLKVSVPREVAGPVKTSLDQTLREINKKAPNAKIMLMGYPKLLENDGSCVPGIGTAEAPWLNDMVGLTMNPMMQSLANSLTGAGIPVTFANPIADFAGMAICGSPESIHGIVTNKTAGDKPSILDQPTSSQSFHPKIGGTTLYANAADRALRVMGK